MCHHYECKWKGQPSAYFNSKYIFAGSTRENIAAESQTFSQTWLNLPQNKNHPSSGEPQPVHKKHSLRPKLKISLVI